MSLDDEMDAHQLLINNTPIDDFLGLTPNEIHELIYTPFGESSPVQLRKNIHDDILDQIPLFRIAEEYLKIIQRDQQVKMTPKGAMPKKVIVELYEMGFLLEELIETGLYKLGREEYCISIMSARFCLELSGLVKKRNGNMSLTKLGTQTVESKNRTQLFTMIFRSFTEKFNWSFHDGFEEERCGQFAWPFSLILLYKFGKEERKASYYAEQYLKAFPTFLDFFESRFSSREESFIHCYNTRTFDRFFIWFGFASLNKLSKFSNYQTNLLKSTGIIDHLFEFKL